MSFHSSDVTRALICHLVIKKFVDYRLKISFGSDFVSITNFFDVLLNLISSISFACVIHIITQFINAKRKLIISLTYTKKLINLSQKYNDS